MSRRALVIAITRLGDLIQTEPLLRALKRRGVGKVTLLIEKSFLDIAELLESVDEIKTVDFGELLGGLDLRRNSLPMSEYMSLAKWLREGSFDEVVNVTHSRPSMMLAAIASGKGTGVSLNRQGMQVVGNSWFQYFFATNLARPWCSYNLTDIYVNAVDPKATFAERKPRIGAPKERPAKGFTSWSNAEILLHVGASKSDKQWPLENFVALSKLLLDRSSNVTLIGQDKSGEVGKAFPTHSSFRNLLGITSVPDLFNLCSNADLLVSADSGPVHIAAACNLPIVAIEGGSSHGFETAPYSLGALVIQPHLDNLIRRSPGKQQTSAPASRISVETVMSSVQRLIEGGGAIEGSTGCTAYETIAGTDIPGIELRVVADGHLEFEMWQKQLRRFWWAALSDGNFLEDEFPTELGAALKNAENAAHEITVACGSRSALDECARRLTSAEQALAKVIHSQPALHHVNSFLQIARSSLFGDGPLEQANELATIYGTLAKASCAITSANGEKSELSLSYQNRTKVLA